MTSIDMNVRDAVVKIGEMANINDIYIFIDGDERKTVTDAAEKKIGEVRGPKQLLNFSFKFSYNLILIKL